MRRFRTLNPLSRPRRLQHRAYASPASQTSQTNPHGLSNPPEPRTTITPSKLSPSLFTARYWPQILPRTLHIRFNDTDWPLYAKQQARIAARDPQTLWWQMRVSVAALMKKKSVRAWCVNRSKRAFEAALVARGWDLQGRRTVGGGEGGEGAEAEGLVGTLVVYANKECLLAEWEDVKRQAEVVVEMVEKKCGTKA